MKHKKKRKPGEHGIRMPMVNVYERQPNVLTFIGGRG
jgi:hypothetical protein